MDGNRDYVISIELSAEDWRAFLELEPQPVTWLRERIQESIARAREAKTTPDAEVAAV
jgi:cytochrome c-type biogenesis protein CcmH/NrfG